MKANLRRNPSVLSGMHHAALGPDLWHPSLIENISLEPLAETSSGYGLKLLELRTGTFATMAAALALLMCLPL